MSEKSEYWVAKKGRRSGNYELDEKGYYAYANLVDRLAKTDPNNLVPITQEDGSPVPPQDRTPVYMPILIDSVTHNS